MKTLPLLVTAILLLTSAAFAQPPVNDNCATANTLILSCTTPTNGTVSGATQSDTAITCGVYTSAAAMDVWYKFIATNGIAYDITVVPSDSFDAVIDLRTSNCSSHTSLGCADNNWEGGTEVLTFTATATGTYYIRVYPFMNSVTDTPATKTFTICVVQSVGIAEQEGEIPVTVYPNPSAGKLNVTINKAMNDASLTIYNSLGAIAYSEKMTTTNNFSTVVDLKEAAGIYLLEIKDGHNMYLRKIVVQK